MHCALGLLRGRIADDWERADLIKEHVAQGQEKEEEESQSTILAETQEQAAEDSQVEDDGNKRREDEGGDKDEVATASQKERNNMVVVVDKPGCNITWLEQVSPLPVGTKAIEIIAYGIAKGDLVYNGMDLSLKAFDVL